MIKRRGEILFFRMNSGALRSFLIHAEVESYNGEQERKRRKTCGDSQLFQSVLAAMPTVFTNIFISSIG